MYANFLKTIGAVSFGLYIQRKCLFKFTIRFRAAYFIIYVTLSITTPFTLKKRIVINIVYIEIISLIPAELVN